MIRVLHISTFHLSGGAGLAASRLNRALNKAQVGSKLLVGKSGRPEINVFSLDKSLAGKMSFWARFIAERVSFLPYEKNNSLRYSFSPAYIGKSLSSNKLVIEADIIHLHWVNFGLLSIDGIRELLSLGKPVVWTLHDMWAFTGGCHYSGGCTQFQKDCGICPFLKRPSVKDLSFKRLERKKNQWLPQMEQLTPVACSTWLQQEAAKSSLFGNISVASIPNPIDTESFRPVERNRARAELGLDPEATYILFAAAKVSSKLKGFSYLIEAIQILAATVENPEQLPILLVIGGHAELPAESRVRYLGYVSGEEKLTQVYSAADLYVTPSVEDNLPNTVMEALACGTPAVGFEVGGIPEMIDHQVNGYVADYRSAESLAKGIRWVLDHNRDGSLSKAAREKVITCYSEEVVAGRYLQLYRDALSKQKGN